MGGGERSTKALSFRPRARAVLLDDYCAMIFRYNMVALLSRILSDIVNDGIMIPLSPFYSDRMTQGQSWYWTAALSLLTQKAAS